MVVTIGLSAKYIWVVVTHDWSALEVRNPVPIQVSVSSFSTKYHIVSVSGIISNYFKYFNYQFPAPSTSGTVVSHVALPYISYIIHLEVRIVKHIYTDNY